MSVMGLSLTEIAIYPLKSAAGLSLESSDVDRFGLCRDRRWMLVDQQGCFITQRHHPRLSQVGVTPSAHGLQVRAPEREELSVPLPPGNALSCEVEIWGDHCAALDCGDRPARWFSEFLGLSVRLVYMPDTTIRTVSRSYSPEGGTVGFADGYPLLLISQASLDDLNSRLDSPVPMARFRPNLVVGGGEAFQEDHWSRVRVGEMTFRVVKPCERCIMTTIDPAVAKPAKEPLATLSGYRRFENRVLFGQNLVQEGTGRIHLGDPVEILA